MKRSKAPVSVNFVDTAAAASVSKKYFCSTFKGNNGEVAWRPSTRDKQRDSIDLFVGVGKAPTALSLANATHSALRRARQMDRERIVLHVPTSLSAAAAYTDVSLLGDVMLLFGRDKEATEADAQKQKKEPEKKSGGKSDSSEDEASSGGAASVAKKMESTAVVEKLQQFATMSAYEWDEMKSRSNKKKPVYKANFSIVSPDTNGSTNKASFKRISKSDFEGAVRRGRIIGENVNRARTLHNMRPNICTPKYLARQAIQFAKENSGKRDVRVVSHIFGDQLRDRGLNLMHSVGKASCDPPHLVVVEYCGDKKSSESVALVGKGLVMDTGGLNVKAFGSMETMYLDCGGATATFGAFCAAVQLGLPCNVTLVMGCANNAISGNAVQPGEIVRSLKGLTVQIDNTDAEGRLVLADCMTFVQKEAPLKKRVTRLVDVATLTGACCVALGDKRAGIFGNDGQQMRQLIEASNTALEPLWPLPIGKEHATAMKGRFSDLTNCAPGRFGGASSAAAFLARFVEKDVKWSHLDIAGPGCFTASSERFAAGSNGFGVSLLVEWLRVTQCRQQ